MKTQDQSDTSAGAYDFRQIEKHWREYWLAHGTYRTSAPGDVGYDPAKPKCYVLDMFPYPSGDGLHIGHPKGYIASDIYSRFKRMSGYNVLHPMGFDSFGLPAEQYAVEHNVHPAVATEKSIDHYRDQLQFLGLGFDWDREIATSHEDYYRWTQWVFLQLFESWYDADRMWQDEGGRTIRGRATPVVDLIASFDSGRRRLSPADRQMLASLRSDADDCTWAALTEAQRQHVINNYRMAYQKEVTVNWCPRLGTVLANEEVTAEGRSEVGDFPVYKRPFRQWMLRITAYADRLLEDLDAKGLPDGRGGTFELDWPEPIKLMQRNWIGRSGGGRVLFDVLDPVTGSARSAPLEVFTTRPDTLFGASFMVVAPGHPLVTGGDSQFAVPAVWPGGTDPRWQGDSTADPREAVAAYTQAAAQKQVDNRVAEDAKEKTGVFTGIFASNPVSGVQIPIFVADYVSMDYGTGAIMAVPAHDDRDHAFAEKYGLPIIQVVAAPSGAEEVCFTGEGTAINSPTDGVESAYAITGLTTAEARAKIVAALEAAQLGARAVSYRLRDWVFSRQRYWGEPFPLANHPDGYPVVTDLPVLLPDMQDFKPSTSDDPDTPVTPPLGRAGQDWTQVDVSGVSCERELNVMPQWAGSCWYYLRFIDPHNEGAFCDAEKERAFMPVDLYIGGAEHAVLHLLYARFWHKVLFDLGHVSSPEPFKKQFSQGMITADAFTDARGVYIDIRKVSFDSGGDPLHTETGEKLNRFRGKMGKRYKNGLPPEEVGEEYGVDTLRLYEMYMGPLEQSAPWSMEGIRGMQRFLQRVWRNLVDAEGVTRIDTEPAPAEMRRLLHGTIAVVGEHLEGLRFNTAIAALIKLNNELVALDRVPHEVARTLLLMLAPLAPHAGEELWSRCGFGLGDLAHQNWPTFDANLLVQDTVSLPVQVNGKVRATIEVAIDTSDTELQSLVLSLENVRRFLPETGEIRRFIVVPGKIVNVVV
ncbi:MAG: class I tRNA ligase family protein [bacterium]|nr:class I tRNA ligase family protein [bacterium]